MRVFMSETDMTLILSGARRLSNDARKGLAIESLSESKSIKQLAEREGVSRKFLQLQKKVAIEALDDAFAAKTDSSVLFNLPVTKAWLNQAVLGLALICHSSYRGVTEFLRDVVGASVSLGTVHNLIQQAASQAAPINRSQDLGAIRVGLHDEIFQGDQPVLAGIEAASTYCYLLEGAEHRDGDTWGVPLLDAAEQGLAPEYTIADAGKGLRAGQKVALGGLPCHGDVFHIQQQCTRLANVLDRIARGAKSRREKLELEMAAAKEIKGNTLSKKLAMARQGESEKVQLARDVKTLVGWLSHDILELAGPTLAIRQELYRIIVDQLQQREHLDRRHVRPVRIALQQQGESLLAFAGVLDERLAGIARDHEVRLHRVREICLLQRKSSSSNAYWQQYDQLHKRLGGKFIRVYDAVVAAMQAIPRASSLVENFNSRLRTYFFLRHPLGQPYLGLLQFFLNHRTFLRSRIAERVGKSPKELMTGKKHPHWLELLGFKRFQPA